MDFQKAMLDELMSQYVDVDNKDFWDDSVCKHYLVEFCPSSLFTNTKSDLGPCDKIHNDRLKEKYQHSPDKHKYPYEQDFVKYLTFLIEDLDKKIRRGRGRLTIQSMDDKHTEAIKGEREEKLVLLDVKIKDLLAKIEEAGEEGRVQEATDLTREVERLQAEHAILKEKADNAARSDKKMEVCTICGAFLVTGDAPDRLDSHFSGKQHQGYQKIRDTLEKMESISRHSGRRDDRRSFDRRDRRDRERDRRDGVKVRTMIEMQIGTVKQTVTAADVMKTWIDHEDPAPDPDPQKDTTEVTDIFAFVLEVNDTAMAAL
ncbi:splicing factor [Umbelopsis nana]